MYGFLLTRFMHFARDSPMDGACLARWKPPEFSTAWRCPTHFYAEVLPSSPNTSMLPPQQQPKTTNQPMGNKNRKNDSFNIKADTPPKKKIQHQHQTKTARKVFSDTSPHPSFLKDSVCTVAILLLGICWWTHLQGHPPTWKHAKSTRVHWSEDDRFLYRKKRNRCRSCRPGEFDKSCLFFGGFMWLDVC